jgi:fatty-acyl-CoA synthase
MTSPPDARTFGALLHEMAARHPDRPAIGFEGTDTSFAAFDRQVDDLARGLLRLGVRHGDRISVLAANRPEWLLVCFAALRIGAVLVPLNTWYKHEEAAYALRRSGARALFSVARLRRNDYAAMLERLLPALREPLAGELRSDGFPALRHVVDLGERAHRGSRTLAAVLEAGREVPEADLRAAEAAVEPGDMAFILFTSGSTAAPKGVQLHHADAIVNDFHIGERQHLTAEDRLWLATPLFYGLGAVNALPAAWTHGTCLVLQETFDPGDALATLERERATAYYGIGNMTRALLDHPEFGAHDLSSLSKGVTGFSAEDKRLAIEALGVSRCCSVYGLTESYGNCALTDADDPLDVRLHTQGHPLPGWELKVVDPETERPLPRGEPGHLLIRGYLTSGYYEDPEATAEAFDADGFFRTGDLAVIREDGRMAFRARLKEVIKVGGINVSAADVEDIIDQHPDVRQVHVVGIPDAVRGEVIVAFVEPGARRLAGEDVQAFVAERAAKFKVPAHVLLRSDDQLPRVASGKVPKFRLREEAIKALERESAQAAAPGARQ